jgi:hypothetical protein
MIILNLDECDEQQVEWNDELLVTDEW